MQGLATEWRTMTYTWRDCALYALAVGAGGAEPQYTYERDMQAIPTFGATPYWGTVNVTPKLPRPRSIPVLVDPSCFESNSAPRSGYSEPDHFSL